MHIHSGDWRQLEPALACGGTPASALRGPLCKLLMRTDYREGKGACVPSSLRRRVSRRVYCWINCLADRPRPSDLIRPSYRKLTQTGKRRQRLGLSSRSRSHVFQYDQGFPSTPHIPKIRVACASATKSRLKLAPAPAPVVQCSRTHWNSFVDRPLSDE